MTILKIDSSINGENSASRALTSSIVEQLKASNWGEQVVTRDLFADPIPHLTLDAFADPTVLQVDYELTGLGKSLLQPISGLAQWALDNVEAIHVAQERFDTEQDASIAA